MDYNEEIICGIGFFILVGIIIGAFIIYFHYHPAVQDLGNAICKETHQGKFIEYNKENKIVKCQSLNETIKYDGIRVEVEDG